MYFLAPPRTWMKIQPVYFAQIYKQSIAKFLYIIMVLFILCAATLSRRNSRSNVEFFLAVVDMCANPFDNGNKLGIACEKPAIINTCSVPIPTKKTPLYTVLIPLKENIKQRGVHMLSERHISSLCVLLFCSYSVYITCPYIS